MQYAASCVRGGVPIGAAGAPQAAKTPLDLPDVGDAGLVTLSEGAIFQGRYRVVRGIKTGGMGAVYEVVHIETRRRRALKVMLPSLFADADMRARFKLEATVTADVDSEYIVETFDAGVD